jgi:PhzF family phenazine biosynthesis protein
MKRRFKQVDVFGARPFTGNPVAVILDGEGLSEEEMTSIAHWTNLSETTFMLPPGYGGDYSLRIFSPKGELAFAGHPTLGSAHAFLESSGGNDTGSLVQECGVGLVPVVASDPIGQSRMVSFESPAVLASTLPLTSAKELVYALGSASKGYDEILVMDVGARWCVMDLGSDEQVTQLVPDMPRLAELTKNLNLTGVTVFGRVGEGEPAIRVRSFAPAVGVPEDPACGSGNACVGAFLAQTSRLEALGQRYTAIQGQEMGRDARLLVCVTPDGSRVDIAGRTITLVDGTIEA